MQRRCDKSQLIKWLNLVSKSEDTYHRERSILWKRFCQILQTDGEIYIQSQHFNTIKSALVCRNDKLEDSKRLALQTAIDAIAEQISIDDELEDDDQREGSEDEGEHQLQHKNR